MPLHPDFEKTKSSFIKKYGEEKGTQVFYAWINKRKFDDTKSLKSQHGNLMKELRICVNKLAFKEVEGEFYSEGFIATDHPDRAESVDEASGKKYAGDIVPKTTLQKIVDTINSHQSPAAEMASHRHDWIREENPDIYPVGKAVSAELRPTGDGHWGAWVSTLHSKNNPQRDAIIYDVKNGFLPGYSIEYQTTKKSEANLGGKEYRILEDIDFLGYGLANARRIANPAAVITNYGFKELMNMPDEQEEKDDAAEEKGESADEKTKDLKKKKKKEDNTMANEKETETKHEISEADFKELEAYKATLASTAKKSELKEAVDVAVKEALSKTSPFHGGSEKRVEMKEFTDYKARLSETKELDKPLPMGTSWEARSSMQKSMVNAQYAEAARLTNRMMKENIPVLMSPAGTFGITHGPSYSVTPSGLYGERLEVKEFPAIETKAGEGLQTDTNLAHASWTYGSYYQSPVEFNDIYGPVMVSQLNDMTVSWGRLVKENGSGQALIQFRARTGRNTTAGGYSEGANLTYGTSFTGNVGRDKFQLPWSYYRVLVAVTGQEQSFAQAPGGMGDIWADEVKWSTVDLLKVLNQALIGTGDGTSESACLGWEGLILGTAGTLYGKNIATYTTLKSFKENMSSAPITLAQMRKMIRSVQGGDKATIAGANARLADLVIFMSPLQKDKVLAIYQSMQRIPPTSARLGFEGAIEIDTVPIFVDPDLNTDDVFLIDTAHTKIRVNLGPVIEQLPVTADARAAQIKIYFNQYSDAPSNNYWSYGFATA